MSAGRADSGAGGFGTTMGTMDSAVKAGNLNEMRQVRNDYVNHVIDQNGAGTLLHQSMKDGYTADNIIPVLQKRLQDAAQSGDQQKLMREFALVDNIHQTLQQTKPSLANAIGDSVMNMKIDAPSIQVAKPQLVTRKITEPDPSGLLDSSGKPRQIVREVTETVMVTQQFTGNVREGVNASRTDNDFKNYHKEFNDLTAEERARMQQNNPGGYGQGPTPPPTSGVPNSLN